jgi:hypothetical protein
MIYTWTPVHVQIAPALFWALLMFKQIAPIRQMQLLYHVRLLVGLAITKRRIVHYGQTLYASSVQAQNKAFF